MIGYENDPMGAAGERVPQYQKPVSFDFDKLPNAHRATEYINFDEAWEAAETTREDFGHFQMATKLNLIRINGLRFWVDTYKCLWYMTISHDNLFLLHKADVISSLHTGAFYEVHVRNGGLQWDEKPFTREQCQALTDLRPAKFQPIFIKP